MGTPQPSNQLPMHNAIAEVCVRTSSPTPGAVAVAGAAAGLVPVRWTDCVLDTAAARSAIPTRNALFNWMLYKEDRLPRGSQLSSLLDATHMTAVSRLI